MTPAKRQYLAAGLIAVVLITSQLLDIADYHSVPWADRKAHGYILEHVRALIAHHPSILVTLLAYGIVFISSHFLLLFCAVATYRSAASWAGEKVRDSNGWSSLFAVAVSTSAVLWNQSAHPYSIAFPNSDLLLRQTASPLLVWGLAVIVGTIVLLGISRFVLKAPKKAALLLILGSSITLAAPAARDAFTNKNRETVTAKLPNVIIIGIDSLRPDYVYENGFPDRQLMPTINTLLERSAVFSDTTTPLARTFVSYMSVLSGQYPTRHGVRFNLYPRSRFKRDRLLTNRFNEAGYVTYFTTDESRFSNIDESFGFHRTETPPTGVLDFIIGSMYDSVATNLLASNVLTSRLFTPHLYGNRAANRLYRPDQHTHRISGLTRGFPTDKPIFLISHYCLPHWPYSRSNKPDEDMKQLRIIGTEYEATPVPYLRALKQVDLQIGSLINELRRTGRMENSILVILSDHGEGLALAKDRLTSVDSNSVLSTFDSNGHGGFALADTQYHVVLAMQRYKGGVPQWSSRSIEGSASLIDIAPTLLEATSLFYNEHDFDGISLLPYIESKYASLPERSRFVESGLNGLSVETNAIDERTVASEFSGLYDITDDGRFQISPAELEERLDLKQRGVYAGRFGLATRPRSSLNPNQPDCWILADYDARTIHCVEDPMKSPMLAPLASSVCNHFKNDSGFIERWCARSMTH